MTLLTKLTLAITAALLMLTGCGSDGGKGESILLVTLEGNLPHGPEGEEWSHRELEIVSPELLPSAASMLTGLFPPEHGLRVDGVGALGGDVDTLATIFASRGYSCGAFLSNIALSRVHGLSRGFERYEAMFCPSNTTSQFTMPASTVVDRAIKFASGVDPSKRVFIWVHLSPFAGVARDDRDAAGESVLGEISRLVAAVNAPVSAIVPLYGLGADMDFRGLTLEDPDLKIHAYLRGLNVHPLGVADIPFALGAVKVPPDERYTESLVPWYALRLPPLERHKGVNFNSRSAIQGLAPVRPLPLATQTEALVLRAQGHLGEGLVPPYTNGPAHFEISSNDFARVTRARRALFMNQTNRLEALKDLVKSDPDVPLFHQALGEALLERKDYAEACNAFARAENLGFNMIYACRMQSKCHTALGNIPAAIDRAESAFLMNETDPLVRHELVALLLRTGAAFRAMGDYSSARDCLSRTILLEPSNVTALAENARLYMDMGQTNVARKIQADIKAITSKRK